jgi:hypothetical protein
MHSTLPAVSNNHFCGLLRSHFDLCGCNTVEVTVTMAHACQQTAARRPVERCNNRFFSLETQLAQFFICSYNEDIVCISASGVMDRIQLEHAYVLAQLRGRKHGSP